MILIATLVSVRGAMLLCLNISILPSREDSLPISIPYAHVESLWQKSTVYTNNTHALFVSNKNSVQSNVRLAENIFVSDVKTWTLKMMVPVENLTISSFYSTLRNFHKKYRSRMSWVAWDAFKKWMNTISIESAKSDYAPIVSTIINKLLETRNAVWFWSATLTMSFHT